jgi:L-arabinose isomerase
MLEICPSIAAGKPSLEVHPLGIGGKADPVRLVFDTPPARPQRLADRPRQPLPPARQRGRRRPPRTAAAQAARRPALWQCRSPISKTACAAWIHAGGAHHTGFSQAVTTEMIEDFATIAGIELVVIDADTRLRRFRQELDWNEVAYGLRHAFTC